MNPFKQRVVELTDQAQTLHTRERTISLESVELVGELERRNASGYLFSQIKGYCPASRPVAEPVLETGSSSPRAGMLSESA